MSYRTFMPLILDQLGFPVFADYFDEPEVSMMVLSLVVYILTMVRRNLTSKGNGS